MQVRGEDIRKISSRVMGYVQRTPLNEPNSNACNLMLFSLYDRFGASSEGEDSDPLTAIFFQVIDEVSRSLPALWSDLGEAQPSGL